METLKSYIKKLEDRAELDRAAFEEIRELMTDPGEGVWGAIDFAEAIAYARLKAHRGEE